MDKEYDEMTEEEYESRIVKTESMYDFFKEEAYMLSDENKKLKKKYNLMKENANQLARKIDRAIAYIEYKKGLFTKDVVQTKVIEDLLEILKGEDKE